MAQQQKAFQLLEKQGKTVVGTRPIPTPGPNQVLVKNTAVAINPVDWFVIDYGIIVDKYPSVPGIDAAGIVEDVGSGVKHFKKGDRVAFEGEFNPPDVSTFQQYALADADVAAKIPSNVSDDEASTIPLGSTTALFGIFQKSGTEFPENGPTATGKSIFIFGGSTSVGQFAIQLARIAGFSVIATSASAKHLDNLKSLGATHVFERDASLDTIQAAIKLPFNQVFDIVSTSESQSLGTDLLLTPSPAPGAHHGGARPLPTEAKAKLEGKTTYHDVFGSSQMDKALSGPYWKVLTRWLEEEKIVPNRVQVVPGGLDGVVDALNLSRKGVSGVKLVVHPQE